MGTSTPFVTDLQIQTLNYLEQLLSNEFKVYKTYVDWPPSQQQECVLVSVLHLLTLQVKITKSVYLTLHYFNALFLATVSFYD